MMKSFRKSVPIKKFRSELKDEGRIKSLHFRSKRCNYSWRVFHSFKFLENLGSNLSTSSKQDFNGANVIDRRGALYLYEVKKVRILRQCT